jgi:hypothetical protein
MKTRTRSRRNDTHDHTKLTLTTRRNTLYATDQLNTTVTGMSNWSTALETGI